ncbi:MFS transporter [Kitasatospora sp. NPDC059811]|uniref:MFS transporter n=1 Tax=Streptomycetaceae TaxID=2062 RepID=UPI0007AF43F9|nr:MFS transporter [Streptomyces sp. MJM8645]
MPDTAQQVPHQSADKLPRVFYRLALGDALSTYGSQLDLVALSLFAYEAAGNALGTAGYLIIRLAGGLVGGLVSGRLVARTDRRRLMTGCALAQALALVVVALAPVPARIPVLYSLALVFGGAAAVCAVALRTSIPEMVGSERRARANSLMASCRSAAMVLGFASAGVVVAWAGFRAALLIDASSFLVFAAVVLRLPLRTRAEPAEQGAEQPAVESADAAGGTKWRGSRWQALIVLRAAPVVGAMAAIRLLDAFGSAAHNISLPVFANQHSPGNPAALLGMFWATWAVGNLGAQQLVSRLLLRRGIEPGERAFALGTCLMSGCFILVFTGLPTPLFLLAAIGAGLGDGFTEISYTTRIQALADERRGQAFGLLASAENVGMGTGMLLSGSLLALLSPLTVVGVSHAVPIVLALGFLVVVARSRKR